MRGRTVICCAGAAGLGAAVLGAGLGIGLCAGAAHAAPVYDMSILMGQPNPMAPAPSPPGTPAPAPARAQAPAQIPAQAAPPPVFRASDTQIYDMSIFLGQPNPAWTGAQFPVTRPGAPENSDAGFGDDFGGDFSGDFGDDLNAVSGAPIETDDDENDPLEPFNRMVFQFNQLVQDIVLDPAAYVYTSAMPDEGLAAVDNAMTNLGEPVTLANDLLQLEFERAWNTTQRTVVNSAIGGAGLFDVAGDMGVPYHREDFGQTLAVYGMPEPFYMMLPVYGPSNPRDASGLFVHRYMDAYGHLIGRYAPPEAGLAIQVTGGVNAYRKVQPDLASMRETSIDYYAALRSLYRQNRAGDITNSDGVYVPDDLDYDLDGDF